MQKKLLLFSLVISLNAENLVTSAVKKGAEKVKGIQEEVTQVKNVAKTENISSQTATAAPAAALKTQTPPQQSGKLTIAQATMKAVNSIRTHKQICSNPVSTLNWNKALYYVTKEHTLDMAVNRKLSHDGSGTATDGTAQRLKLGRGSHFYERVNQEKDSKKYISGELVIRTDLNTLKSPKDLLEYWAKRPNDCKTIMDPRFTDVALAKVVSNKEKRAYWTLMLMGPHSASK